MCNVDALSKAPMVVNSLVDSLLLIGQTSTNHARLHFYRFYYTWEFHTRNAAVPTHVATKLRSEKWKARIRVVLFEGDHPERARKNLLDNYTSSWDSVGDEALFLSLSAKPVASSWAVGWLFFFICSFVSSVLIDQCDGYIVGTCAETVAKRTVQQEENIVMVVARGTVECGGDTRVVIVFARWARAAWLCSVAPSRRGQSRREVVSSSFFVCNGCGIFLFFLFFFFSIACFSCCCCSPKIFLFWCRGWQTQSVISGPCTARLLLYYWGKTSAFASSSSFGHMPLTTSVYVISSCFLTLFCWSSSLFPVAEGNGQLSGIRSHVFHPAKALAFLFFVCLLNTFLSTPPPSFFFFFCVRSRTRRDPDIYCAILILKRTWRERCTTMTTTT